MKLDKEFYRLPLRFEAERLAAEVLQFEEAEWRAHPQGHAGNTAIPLVSVDGGINDAVSGPMAPTPFLARCPYLRQVLASLGTVVGRSRLMRIAGESDATPHVDSSYYWRHHVRVHVPAVTYPEVRFLCGEKEVHMAAGEAWIFDTWRIHNVINPRKEPRIHLVVDTVGSPGFWEMLEGKRKKARAVHFQPEAGGPLELETKNFPLVMTPWEQELLMEEMFASLDREAQARAKPLREDARELQWRWRSLWARFGDEPAGWERFRTAAEEFNSTLEGYTGKYQLTNQMDMVEALRQAVVRPALNLELAERNGSGQVSEAMPAVPPEPLARALPRGPFDQPVFIVGAPRSGGTMLFELLARSPGFVTIGGESHHLFEGIEKLRPDKRKFHSNRLTEKDADAETATRLKAGFLAEMRTSEGHPVESAGAVSLLEKTPKNALRIPFLRAVFPQARFIFLYRDPRENISSILDAWRSGGFVTYPGLPEWKGEPWSLALIPGWKKLKGRPLAEVATAQWTAINAQILADLEAIPREQWCAISYAEVLADPQAAAARLCDFAGAPWTETLSGELPLSRHTLTPPAADKWRKNEREMAPFLPRTEEIAQKVRTVLEAAIPRVPSAPLPAPVELNSVHTENLPHLLRELGISLLVTTYQAGRLIVMREQEGTLNTHFRTFFSPMGMAYDGHRLAVAAKREICHFVNQPEVAPKLPPVNTHDCAFMPRASHHTGDIRIHEIAYAGEELWAVNTRFSCLCTFDAGHSFTPRWRPPFVTALAPEDRCHLNGLAMVDGAPTYVTCLGATDTPGGWRENKARGGCLLHVPSGDIVAGELCMPHSPRLYGGHLWLLESGEGTLSRLDPKTGRTETIARMPGFTRGLDFFGPYAFVGLSQVREKATFSGLPLTERLPEHERGCGVWVVDLRSGAIVAFLQFQSGVQEIFAIQVLPGITQPDIVTDDEEILDSSFVLPESSLPDVPRALISK